ncbi:MAG: thymidine kinase [Clostridia bacterium]|nr:thymidine kinase [Clostridia bacterium]
MYFYYGVMGSSKTANALMKKFNFEERGRTVALLKPSLDTRNGKTLIKSRIGLSSEAFFLDRDKTIKETIGDDSKYDTIMIDEAQFLTVDQVDELREMADNGIMVMCYGLKTDYTGHLFEGSKRLVEVSDTIREIQSMCSKCGTKAIVNARYCGDKVVYVGNIIDIGGEEKYITLCHKCWTKGII